MPPVTRLTALWARVVDPAALLLAVVFGALSVTDTTHDATRLVLRILAGLAALYLFIRLTLGAVFTHASHLRDRLERSLGEHGELTDAIDRVLDREIPRYTEEIRLTVVIGACDEEDLIEEEVVTDPASQVLYRSVRPIVPDHETRDLSLEDLAFTCSVDAPADNLGDPTVLRLGDRRPLRVWIVFEPGLRDKTRWRLAYQPRGLWSPFRERGRDRLAWTSRMPYQLDGTSSLTDFSVRFVFADPSWAPVVAERNGHGIIESRTQLEGGQWEVLWHDPSPEGHRYEWDLIRRVNGIGHTEQS
jgi:hypothetical protein